MSKSEAQLRKIELPLPPEVVEKDRKEKEAARRKNRQSLRVVEGGKSAKSLRKTAEQEQEEHLEKIRAAKSFDHKVETIRTLHEDYKSEQESLMQREMELRSELEDILGPLEGNTAEEIREHHMTGWHKVKDFFRGLSGDKSAKERATPLLKKLGEIQTKRKALHDKQVNISIASLRATAEEQPKSLEQQTAEAWTPPAKIMQAHKDQELLDIANKMFPAIEETAEYKEKAKQEKMINDSIDMMGGVKEEMSDEEKTERRARGRADSARLWDEVNRMIEIMRVPDTDFTALDYVELAARAQKADSDNQPARAASIRGLLNKMNVKLGYAVGQDPVTGAGMGGSRLNEAKTLGGNISRAEQSKVAERLTGVKSESSAQEKSAKETDQTFDKPLSIEWATAKLPGAAAEWNKMKDRMVLNMETSKAVIRDHIDILAQEINGIDDLTSDVYRNFNAIKNIRQGDPAEATMYVMLKAISEGVISLSEGEKKAQAAVRRALKDINRSIAAVTAPVEKTPSSKTLRTPPRRSDEEADVLDQSEEILKRAVSSEMLRAATLPDKTPSQRANKKLAESMAEINELEAQTETDKELATPKHVIDALVYGLPEEAVESYRKAMTKFYENDNAQKRRDVLKVLRGLDAKFGLRSSKTAQRIAITLTEALEKPQPKVTKKPRSVRKAA